MVRRSITTFSFLLFMVLALGSPIASAQVLYGSIVGTVTDQSGAVVPKADVKAINPQTGETREVTTDAAGRYTIGNVLPGIYEIHVTATGFSAGHDDRRDSNYQHRHPRRRSDATRLADSGSHRIRSRYGIADR